jgi:hypothetical protein
LPPMTPIYLNLKRLRHCSPRAGNNPSSQMVHLYPNGRIRRRAEPSRYRSDRFTTSEKVSETRIVSYAFRPNPLRHIARILELHLLFYRINDIKYFLSPMSLATCFLPCVGPRVVIPECFFERFQFSGTARSLVYYGVLLKTIKM